MHTLVLNAYISRNLCEKWCEKICAISTLSAAHFNESKIAETNKELGTFGRFWCVAVCSKIRISFVSLNSKFCMKLTKVNFKKCDTTISKVSSAKQKRDKQVNVVRQVISKF